MKQKLTPVITDIMTTWLIDNDMVGWCLMALSAQKGYIMP